MGYAKNIKIYRTAFFEEKKKSVICNFIFEYIAYMLNSLFSMCLRRLLPIAVCGALYMLNTVFFFCIAFHLVLYGLFVECYCCCRYFFAVWLRCVCCWSRRKEQISSVCANVDTKKNDDWSVVYVLRRLPATVYTHLTFKYSLIWKNVWKPLLIESSCLFYSCLLSVTFFVSSLSPWRNTRLVNPTKQFFRYILTYWILSVNYEMFWLNFAQKIISLHVLFIDEFWRIAQFQDIDMI